MALSPETRADCERRQREADKWRRRIEGMFEAVSAYSASQADAAPYRFIERYWDFEDIDEELPDDPRAFLESELRGVKQDLVTIDRYLQHMGAATS